MNETPVSTATPKSPASKSTPSKTASPKTKPETVARAVRSAPSVTKVSDSSAAIAKDLAGGTALTRLIAGSGTDAGRIAPNFELPNLKGTEISLAGMRGKVVLLNFWATWCGACRSEMPSLEKLYWHFHSYHDFAMLTVSINRRGKATVSRFMARKGYTFPVLLDTSDATGAAYGVSGIPSTFVIGRNGQIIWNCVGALDWSSPRLRDALKRLL